MIKYFVLVGIGGSSLGARAVYDALKMPGDEKIEMLFADTTSPTRIIARLKGVPKEEVMLNVVSKSGTTRETRENFEILKEYAGTVVDTYKELDFDKTIGGRFSVLTEVGLYPLRTCGFDTEEMLRGKADAEDGKASAEWLFEQLEAGMAVHDIFLFGPQLESLGKWYRQLMGESTGKDGKGYFPSVSIGTTDLHSVFQRYVGGPHNIATTFVYVGEPDKYCKATMQAYRNHDMPFQEHRLEALNEYELGKFFETKMREVVNLAHLMGVNPYDQPNVEDYKKLISG
jgi:glucose-6-phosphate isomerase